MNKNMLYRNIPKVDVLLENETVRKMIDHYSRDTVMEAIHIELDKLREFIGRCEEEVGEGRYRIRVLFPVERIWQKRFSGRRISSCCLRILR